MPRRLVRLRLGISLATDGTYRKRQKQLLIVVFSPSVPVSQPVLTLSPPGAQAAEGEVATLHCEVQRGSFPITYQLYHEGAPLKKEEGSSQRAMPFRLPLTTERSGSYDCSADNGFGPRRSEGVHIPLKGKP